MRKAFRAFWVNGIERLPIGRVKERSSRRNAVAPIRQGDTNAAAKHVGGGGLRLTSVAPDRAQWVSRRTPVFERATGEHGSLGAFNARISGLIPQN